MRADDSSIDSVETVDNEAEHPSEIDDEIVHEQPPRPEDARRPPAVRKLDSNLDGHHWKDSMVGSVIHEHYIKSVN